MRGHVRRRGTRGLWAFVLDAGRTEDGRRQQKWHSGFATKRAAQAALTETLGRLAQGTYAERTKLTLREYLTDWLLQIRPSVRASTWASYQLQVQSHIVPRLGAVALQAITPAMLNRMYADLIESGRRIGSGGLSLRSVRYIHMVLRRSLQSAVRQNLVSRNPADAAEPPRPGRVIVMKTWTALELRAFLEHVQTDRLSAAWLVLATTGLRRGELLGLKWRAVDLEARRISVTETTLAIGYKITTGMPKTARGKRSVSLDSVTVAALRAHRMRQAAERLALGLGGAPDDALVFSRPDGSPIHPDQFSARFDALVKACGLPRIRLHDLRHTAATLMLGQNIHPKVVSERLGHATVAITLDTYSHVTIGMQQEAAEQMARVLFGT